MPTYSLPSAHIGKNGSSTSRVESWLQQIGQIGETNGISVGNDMSVPMSVGVHGAALNLRLSQGTDVQIFSLQGTRIAQISGGGSHTLNLLPHNTYVLSAKENRTGRRTVKKLTL